MAGASDTGRGPWYYGWSIVAVCVVSQIAANAMPINAFSLFLKGWAAEFHAPISVLQLGIVSCGLGCALVSPIVGILVDRSSPRLMLAIGLVLTAVFCLGISVARSTGQYIALYAAIVPFSLSLATSLPANAVISRWFVRRRGLALGISAFGLGMGGVIMPPVIAAALPLFGWRAIWRVAGIIVAVVVLPLVWFVVRDRPSAHHGTRYTGGDAAAAAHGHGHGGGAGAASVTFGIILRSRTFWLLLVAYIPMLAVYGGLAQNVAPIAAGRGASPQMASVLVSMLYGGQVVLTLVVGALSDRYGNRRPLAALAFASALAGILVASTHDVGALAVAAVLAGAGGAFWPLLAGVIATEFGANGFGRAFGALTFFLPLTVSAPFAVAKVQEGMGSYTPIFVVLALLSAIGGVAALMIREGRGPRTPEHREPEAIALV